mgnify:CR=1 FL=1
MSKRIVIALGGNALGNTAAEQLQLVTETAKSIVDLIAAGNEVVVAHGNGPQVGMINLGLSTAAEAKAIKEVFGEHTYKLNISSTKSMTGHLLGAAGAVEALACVKAVSEDIVPPTINHDEEDKDPEIDYALNYTFNQAQKLSLIHISEPTRP